MIGIPKTIDNDIPFIGQSFGFVTAFTEAARAINAAMVEAHSAIGGVGLIKLMGRHAGFIACYAALANHVADFVLIPEVPFRLDGPTGFLACLEQRVKSRGSAVVVVAEGAGQEILQSGQATDASGNARLADIGLHLRSEIGRHFAEAGVSSTLKYIDPSYMIRSVPACPHDSVYCVRLAQAAAHAGMAGRTAMVVGRRHNRFIHVPDRPAHVRAQPGRPARRPVAQRARVDRPAGLDAVTGAVHSALDEASARRCRTRRTTNHPIATTMTASTTYCSTPTDDSTRCHCSPRK